MNETLYKNTKAKIEASRSGQVKHSYMAYWHKIDEDTIALKHHNTDIIEIHENNRCGSGTGWELTIYNGGYFSVTTKKKINSVINPTYSIFQRDFKWYLNRTATGECTPYFDGCGWDEYDALAPLRV